MSAQERRHGARPENDARTRCYEQIRECARRKVLARYKDHPEWLLDQRAQVTVEGIIEELQCIFDVLNRYELTDKP